MSFDPKINIQAIIQAFGLVSIILLFIQLRMNNRWNRIKEALNIAVKDNLSLRRKELKERFDILGMTLENASLTDQEIEKILKDENCRNVVNAFLSELELIAAAANLGAMNEHFTYCMFSGKMLLYEKYFSTFIARYRVYMKDEEYYTELQSISRKWEKQFQKSNSAIKKKKASLKKDSPEKASPQEVFLSCPGIACH